MRPLWEDEENIEGGCWVLKVRKEDGRALRTWEEVCLLVLGGEVGSVVARGELLRLSYSGLRRHKIGWMCVGMLLTMRCTERDHILGISYSPRLYVAHISIWTKQGANRQSIEALQKTVVSRLSPELQPKSEMDYYYKKHSQHEGWEEAVKSKKAAEQESDVQNGPVS